MNVPWTRPSLGAFEKDALDRVWDSNWHSQGKEVEAFEKEICDYIGCKYAVCVNNGTTALMLAYLTLRLIVEQDKDIVSFISSSTFIATSNASKLMSIPFKPVDVDIKTGLSELKHFEESFQNYDYNVFVPVHLLGNAVNISVLNILVDKHKQNSFIIEDACQAFGTITKDGMIGKNSEMCVFSFHAAKLLSTVEGGCIVTNSKYFYQELKSLRNHGMQENYECIKSGMNGRMTDLSAALGRAQLQTIEESIDRRVCIAEIYFEELKDLPIEFVKVPNYVIRPTYSIFAIVCDNPDELKSYLRLQGIDARRFFPPIESQICNKNVFDRTKNAQYLTNRLLLLPTGNAITAEEVKYVCNKINQFYNK